MIFKDVFEQFVAESPVSVMVRAALENVFAPEKVNAVFSRAADKQYTRELMFSAVVDVMGLVVCRIQPSVHAAYQKKKEELAVTAKALYDKLNHVELATSQELVRYSAQHIGQIIRHMGGMR